jgi:hypothetical protein
MFAIALSPLAVYAKDSSKDLSIEVVETTEDGFSGKNPPSVTYSAKVILPDGAHAYLVCFWPTEGCGRIEPWTPPERTVPADCQFSDFEGGHSSCKRKNLGTYRAKRKGDDLLIYDRKGKVTYQIAGPWSNSTENNPAKESAPWNRTAIRAEFVELATSDRKDTIRLWYTLTNTTEADYRIESMIGITTAAQAGSDSLYAFNQGMISVEMPLTMPAHRKIQTLLTVALQTDKSVPNDASDATVAIYKKDVMTFLRSKYSKMQGFVLMDEGTRYEIDFPGAWSQTER